MLTSGKLFGVFVGLYTLVVFVPALLGSGMVVPAPITHRAVAACFLFLVGLGIGAVVFRFPEFPAPQPDSREFQVGLGTCVTLTVAVAGYVAVFGPRSPFLEAFSLTDPLAISMVRENAIKLNPDVLFGRVYSWGRDIFAPVTAILSVTAFRTDAPRRTRWIGAAGLLAALYLGLWSGQKATVANYFVAGVIFSTRSVWRMVRMAALAVPVLLLSMATLFWITLPQLVGDPRAMSVLATSMANRIIFGSLEVSGAYIDALERVHTITRGDAIPYLTAFWRPGIVSVENEIGLHYFTSLTDSSIHANAPAFTYAYVLGGFVGCILGGLLTMFLVQRALRIVAATGSSFITAAYTANLCYILIDLSNGNFLGYLVKVIVLAILVWLSYELTSSRHSPFAHSFSSTGRSSSVA